MFRIPSRQSVFSQLSQKIQKLVEPYESLTKVPVHWGEQDIFGHLNHVYHLRYFETARINHSEQVLRPKLSVKDFDDFVKGKGVGPIVKSIHINYKAITYSPDNMVVAVRIKPELLGPDRFVQEW